MNSIAQFENRASSRRSKHEGESSYALCDRLSRTRDFSQRQLPTDQDYAVSTREYQTDQSSLKPAPAATGPVLDQRQKQRQQQKQPHWCAEVDRVTPYQSHYKQQGLFAPRTLLRFLTTTDPAESLSLSADFPVSSVIRLPCSVDFSTGRGGFLQLLSMTLSPCCPYQPRRSVSPHQSLRRSMLPSPESGRLGLRGSVISGPYGFTCVTARRLARHP
jgi:hypothetical protein